MADITNEWKQYEIGKDYKRKINLYNTVDTNERQFSGNQWQGVQANGLPTPVFNIFKRVINWFIASIMSQAVKMQFVADGVNEETEDEEELRVKAAAELISAYSETLWENLKMPMHLRQALLDAALSGDMAGYNFWNPDVDTGQEAKGDIEFELVDNVNVFFGNPNDRRAQKQPYIIISFRELVGNLREEARKNGVKESDISLIASDTDNQEQSGDMAKIELDAQDADGKTTAILKLWRNLKTGTIWFNKSTKAVVIRKDVDTKQKLYPVPWANWDVRKNSYHGQAVGTGLVPNQLFINKMFAMVMVNLMHTAFPTVVYNETLIPSGWSNQIGQAIPVQGGEDMTKVAKYLQPGEMSSQVMSVIDAAINYTKDLVGASDAALGDVKPENTSAIIAVQQAASVPLENIKANLYQWVEDIGLIWLDFMATKYGKRKITITEKGKRVVKEFDFNQLQNMRLKLKIDVGPSSYWSEITAMQTLDHLLEAEKISFLQYLERVPNGLIPQKQELIEELQAQMEAQANAPEQPQEPPTKISITYRELPIAGQIQAAAMAGIQLTPDDFAMGPQMPADGQMEPDMEQLNQFAQSLPPEIQQMMAQMPEEEAIQHMQMMMQLGPEEMQAHMAEMMAQASGMMGGGMGE